MLVTCARNSKTRDSFSGMIFVNAMSNTLVPGPTMLLRRASPYCPAGGATKDPVLNHFLIDGLEILTLCPGTRSGRNVPFEPRLTSAKFPSRRGVKGKPEANVQSPLTCQSPTIARNGELPESQRLSCPKGNSNR